MGFIMELMICVCVVEILVIYVVFDFFWFDGELLFVELYECWCELFGGFEFDGFNW